MTGAVVERVLFDDRRARSVAAVLDGRPVSFDCSGEVIVASGALESPLLLQRSGIGPADRLRDLGIAPVTASPDVGERLREYLAVAMPHRLKADIGTGRSFHGVGLAKAMAQYFPTRRGIIATGPSEIGAFTNVAHPDNRTDLQLYLGGYTFALGDDNHPVPLSYIDKAPAFQFMASCWG